MTFLQDNGFDAHVTNAEQILEAFREEMVRGLSGTGSLPMLPAMFPLNASIPCNCEVAAFDVGGTNIRSARVRFDTQGKPEILNQLHGFMPGSRGAVSYEEFYRVLCDALLPNIRKNECLGYCFSYPVDSTGNLLFWTKGIQAASIVGRNAVSDLTEALATRGVPNVKIRILNDTVAALLAAYVSLKHESRAGYVGFILGTGTNTAYAEVAERIPKARGLRAKLFYPVNCESGNFTRFNLSYFDERHEAVSGTGRALWERCISGVHLGPLGTEILHAAAEAKLFSSGVCDAVLGRKFTNVELDGFCSGKMPEVLYCSSDEAQTIRELICPMYERAARFAAINVAAAALQSADARGARSGTIRINADGSTFWKTASIPFVDVMSEQLTRLLRPRGFDFEIVRIADAPLIGAALGAKC